MNLLDIPDYAEAVDLERVSRDAAFVGMTESVGPFELEPMTLRQYLLLRIIGHPLLRGALPSPQGLTSFLWILTPESEKPLFAERCKAFIPPRAPWLKTRRAMRVWRHRTIRHARAAKRIIEKAIAYVDATMQDRPPTQGGGFDKEYFSDAAGICASLAREYHWSEAEVLDMPIKRIFQYVNESKVAAGRTEAVGNPSDRVLNAHMLKINNWSEN